jgi:uncharacterized protein (TIGR02598 family)
MTHYRSTGAFSLVEVTLALGVMSIALVAVFGLLPIGLQTTSNSLEQNGASDILALVCADLRGTPPTAPRGSPATSTQFGIAIPAAGSTATATLYFNTQGQISPSPAAARYRVTVNFPNNGGAPKTATFVHLKATWPALASVTDPVGSAEMFTALDRN